MKKVQWRKLAEEISALSGTAATQTEASSKLLGLPNSYFNWPIVEQFVEWLEKDHPTVGVRCNALSMIGYAFSLGAMDRRARLYRRCAAQIKKCLGDSSSAVRAAALNEIEGLTKSDSRRLMPTLKSMAINDRKFPKTSSKSNAMSAALAYAAVNPKVTTKRDFVKCVESFGFKYDPNQNSFQEGVGHSAKKYFFWGLDFY
jgi:hypothetical protein